MKLLISTIVTAIVLFLLSWLTYGVILANQMAAFPGMRTPEDMRMWAIIVGTILQAFFMCYVYSKVYKGESPFMEGFLFGFLLSLIIYVPYIFYFWGSYGVKYTLVIADGVSMGIRMTIAGILIGLIFGKKQKAS